MSDIYLGAEEPLGSQPGHIDGLFDDLDELPPNDIASYIAQLSPSESYWLADYLRSRVEKDRERAPEEIDVELSVRVLSSSFNYLLTERNYPCFLENLPSTRCAEPPDRGGARCTDA